MNVIDNNLQALVGLYQELVDNLNEKGLDVTISDGLEIIVPKVLKMSSSDNLLEELVIADNTTFLKANDFTRYPNLKKVTFPSNLTEINDYSFFNYSNLEDIELPNSIQVIGASAFENCDLRGNKQSYILGSPVGNKYLRIPPLASIGSRAFANNVNLNEVSIEGTPDKMAADVFEGCDSLTRISVSWSKGTVPGAPWGAKNATVAYSSYDEW